VDLEQDTLELLERKLEKLEGEVRATKASIAFFRRERGQTEIVTDETKYIGWPTLNAVRDYLESEGDLRTGKEILRALERGGQTKKREGQKIVPKRLNSAVAGIKRILENGHLTLHEGGKIVPVAKVEARTMSPDFDLDAAVIGLPEWKQK
jgi:hypothetical protein